jgi:hypothetical protein
MESDPQVKLVESEESWVDMQRRERLEKMSVAEVEIENELAWNRMIERLKKAGESRDVDSLTSYFGLPHR